jgi:hypothetical protein
VRVDERKKKELPLSAPTKITGEINFKMVPIDVSRSFVEI